MNAAESALVLIAEAAAHGVTVIYNNGDIGLGRTDQNDLTDLIKPKPTELTEELEAAANEIWAVLHHYRMRANK